MPEKYKEITKKLLSEQATQVVPGHGNPDADIMFIGEAPGAKEDAQGKPFVGPAGKFLDELLKSIDLKREDVWISNMVKVRPPENRDPEEDEIQEYKPWLDEEIEIIDPKVFVPLGRFALGKFIPGQQISKVHGKGFKRGGKLYFAMYHPAAALYKGSMRSVLIDDMQNLKRILEGDESLVESLEDTVSEVQELLKKSKDSKEEEKQMGLGI
ncbi:MAG TPA: uracil-DNA glycosylase [bacterium]|nr:uracil-DNA glycosylase [bacterium]